MHTQISVISSLILLCVAVADGLPEQEPHTPFRQQELASMVSAAPIELTSEVRTVRISVPEGTRSFFAVAAAPASASRVILHIDGITFDEHPDLHYQVFVDLPDREQPSHKSVYFVGNLSFFFPHTPTAQEPAAASFDITSVVRALQARKAWNPSELSVTFVARGLEDREGNQLPVPSGVRARFTSIRVVGSTSLK
jgi:Protein of unknown function (DUF_B2219)